MPEPNPPPTPLVHRAVRTGGILLAIAAAQFVAVMLIVEQHFAGYSLTGNYISDLGGVHSPWALLFDASVILLGAIVVPALLLIWSSFDTHPARSPGLVLLMLGACGAIAVGVFPETTHLLGGRAHDVASFVTFIGGAVGLVVLSFAMRRPDRWRFSGRYTLLSGVVSAVAIVLFGLGYDLTLGVGGMERLVVAPLLLWMVVEGAHIGLLHRFAPGLATPHVASI
ncbi:MAG TPA: DUF998 domain-containing protein [Thermoplasmata archaeon]|nr:DUF998 domain-containing protein [Thermoplasmata archaeon]